ncbi:hypothetical protein H6P81_008210 [Aristolochia fimbriata]|uniref:Uncharacterized protein n=1 Tax=Aristolochia fimbriata TaxID=158543 RepID=A0AAV7F592_ARIFI|nr:hypothetical protein H6P81_008210 [Aristolochia fimbriata]
MNALLQLNVPPVLAKRSTPWQQRKPTLQPTPASHLQHQPPRAGAKGFGTPPIAVSGKRNKREEDPKGTNAGTDEDDDAIPQVIFDRMLTRILVSVGIPMGSGIGLVYFLAMLKERGIWDVPQWLPLVAILAAFGTSGLGIAYGTLSTSWDPEKGGSLLGWEEAKQNWPELWKEDDENRSL